MARATAATRVLARSAPTASASSAAANATANVTPKTPPTTARRTVTGLATCEAPRDPQVKPPSGHSPRSQSIEVHSAAAPTAVRNGWPARRTRGNRAPNSAMDRAVRTVRAPHASVPKSWSHDRVSPNPDETEAEAQGEAAGGCRLPERDEQQRGGEERERPGGYGREGEREQHATDQGEGERDRQPAIGQAQSRQNIRRLSASWLRCFTR